MKIAIVWGILFGILQAIVTLVVSVYFSSPDVLTLACVGLLVSSALTLACGAIAAFHGQAFVIGLGAGVIASLIDVLAGIVGSMINPAILAAGDLASATSFIISFGVGLVLSALGAGIGGSIARQSRQTSPRLR